MTKFNNRILIIDDDTRIHEDFRKILGIKEELSEFDEMESALFSDESGSRTSIEYELDSAYQGQEGYEKVLKANATGNPYALAFVDMRMPPGWDGLETIKHIWEEDKHIQLVICTAYSDYSWSEVLYHLGASDRLIILKKPFDMVEVQQIATALTTKWNVSMESAARLQRIRESEEKYRTVIDSVDNTIVTMDENGEIIFVNHNPWSLLEHKGQDNYYLGIKEEYRDQVKESVKDVIRNGVQKNVEFASVGNDHETLWSEGRISPYYKNDEVVAATLVASDITARKALDWQLRHDELTGLANRGCFVSKLEEKLILRDDGDKYAILFIDLDHFNLVNDCFGHELGDKVLVEVSKIIADNIDADDMLARLGGDEFAIFKELGREVHDIHAYTEALRESLKTSILIDGFEIYPSVSIGIVISEDRTDTSTSLMRDADAALYHAKSSGRNRFEYFDQEVRENVIRRVNLGAELRAAIEKNQFQVLYQPIVNVAEKKISGFEALIRWNHPQRGIVSPVEFIPIAEETGLIVQITRKVLEAVCRQFEDWKQHGINDVNIAVNCSAREFKEQDLDKIIADVFPEEHISRLEIELTESSIMDDVNRAIENMKRLAAMGVGVSIDDFGTGYSSFGYIKQFAIRKLKIDRVFIKDTPGDEDDVAIVEAIIAMANRLKIRVVAEGVETADQLKYLASAKCDFIQGYLLGKPMSADDAENLLKQEQDWLNKHLDQV